MTTANGGPADNVPQGWYADPNGLPSDRYWDGQSWTEQTRPQIARAPMPPPTVSFVARPAPYSGGAPRNGMGIAALVLGLIGLWSLLLLPLFILSVLAVIFGSVGLGRVKRGTATNRGMCLAGIWLGAITLAIAIPLVIVYVVLVLTSG